MTQKEQKKLLSQVKTLKRLGLPIDANILQQIKLTTDTSQKTEKKLG